MKPKQTLQQQLDSNNGSNTRRGIGTSSSYKKVRVTRDYGKPPRTVAREKRAGGGRKPLVRDSRSPLMVEEGARPCNFANDFQEFAARVPKST